ncbi:MAG: hypothetical protein ABFQ64_06195, partial [Campylobacterota bacterium]
FTNTLAKKSSVKNTPALPSNSLSALPTKKSDDMSTSYYIVVTILIVGILILFVLKKKMAGRNIQNQQSPWLFQENQESTQTQTNTQTQQTKTTTAPISDSNNDISIRFQKSLNAKNSVVMLDFGAQSYLVLMGSNNILLDKFTDDKPTTQEDFESILQNRHQELDDFLRVESNSSGESAQPKEALQAYKERAASILYEA